MANDEEIKGCASGCAGCSGCGHDHEDFEFPEDMSPIITLTDEDGTEVKFEILDMVVLEDSRSFLVVTEATEEQKEDEEVEVVILEMKQDGEEEVYDTVTDEEVAKTVYDKFVAQMEEDSSEEE